MDKVNVDLDMLRVSMVNWIGRHVDNTQIVTEDNRGRVEGNMEFLQELVDLAALDDSVRNSLILNLNARPGHRALAFGGPRN
jgi:ubiquinone biosynthesis protein UbiJ